jgi:prenyl protein peptidase
MINYFSHLSTTLSSLLCFLMSLLYVSSLYFWSAKNRFNRNSPSVIKRRFLSVFATCIASTFLLYFISKDSSLKSIVYLLNFGFSTNETLFQTLFKSIVPLFLTIILFSGPLVQFYFEKDTLLFSLPTFDSIFWRNYIIGPLTEEYIFRACILQLLIGKLTFNQLIFLTPFYFGLAHLHHAIEVITLTPTYMRSFKFYLRTLFEHLFQFTYTYIFGVYSSFVYLRTGLFLPTFINHAFCNMMGFPDVSQVKYAFNDRSLVKYSIIFMYFFGLISFFLLLDVMTLPEYYSNENYFEIF